MARVFQVDVVSPEATVWSGQATIVIARTPEGELGIMADHEPLMGALATGPVEIESESGERTTIGVHGGFIQVLDNQEGAGRRPVLSAAEKAELAAFLRLAEAELSEAGQTAFSLEDAAYLEEALLVRAGVRSLKIDARPPLERARLGFDWACRMVYVDDRVPWPAARTPSPRR